MTKPLIICSCVFELIDYYELQTVQMSAVNISEPFPLKLELNKIGQVDDLMQQ